MRFKRSLLLLLPILAAAVLVAAPAQSAPGAARATTVRVAATEFKFTLSPKSVKRGAVIFKVKNVGNIAHNFAIKGKTSALLTPGKSTSMTVTFTKAGRYPYRCTIPGHAQQGMKGVLTVK